MSRVFPFASVDLVIAGLGIVLHSPRAAAGIPTGHDYLASDYFDDVAVQRHIQAGSIVGFGTGTPGHFFLDFYPGYPTDDYLLRFEYRLRLGLEVSGGCFCVRDLYDLLDWDPVCSKAQVVEIVDGFYHLTLLSQRPASGRLGDGQRILVFMKPVDQVPPLATEGIPMLCG